MTPLEITAAAAAYIMEDSEDASGADLIDRRKRVLAIALALIGKDQRGLARELGLAPQTLGNAVNGAKSARRVLGLVSRLGVPYCLACGWASCPGCGDGNGAGRKKMKKDLENA